MENFNTELSVNTQVLERMAEIAAKEIEGVSGISKKAVDIKNAVKAKSAFKGVIAESLNGTIKITVYITVKNDAKVREVAEAVQKNVKDKIQTMTGTAVTAVKVVVADIEFDEPDSEE